MCGIFCSISRHGLVPPSDSVQELLQARGPDALETVCFQTLGIFVTLTSTVLGLRGNSIVQQPHQLAEPSSALCWNGEAWKIGGERVLGNDTSRVHKILRSTTNAQAHLQQERGVSTALSQVAGPYSFVFFRESEAEILTGRDFLGRRSLLRTVTSRGDLLLCSITDGQVAQGWTEIEADGIYRISSNSDSIDANGYSDTWGDFAVQRIPYTFSDADDKTSFSVIPRLSLNRQLPGTLSMLSQTAESVGLLENLLRDSLSLRTSRIPRPPTPQTVTDIPGLATLAVLFSGGLDCTVLARMCHDLLPLAEPIDLINVAFENPRVHKMHGDNPFERCPDRITGRMSHAELLRTCPEREWRFVAVDVPYAESQNHRHLVVALMHPHNTEMDLSIASALYFAARGIGAMTSPCQITTTPYTTSARVLLSGLGADELFAGYTRHATAFNRQGFVGLLDELDLDIGRLGKRNLGRDDRVISHWGREARFPFLDEALLQWALCLPITQKCGFGEVETTHANANDDESIALEPNKKILRCLAWKLGMTIVAKEKKRAIQFGARTAKMETGKTKGTQSVS